MCEEITRIASTRKVAETRPVNSRDVDTSTPHLHDSVSTHTECNICIVQIGYCKITDLAEIHTLIPTQSAQSIRAPSPEQ